MASRRLKTGILAVAVMGWFGVPCAIGDSFQLTTWGSFDGLNGAYPYGPLVQTLNGDVFGTTFQGGKYGLPNGYGTVFKLTGSGTFTNLLSFAGPDGAKPYAGLIQHSQSGDLYGVTWLGGVSNLGTIFRFNTNGSLMTVYSFTNGNGAKPSGTLLQGLDGGLYGTTQSGGASNVGTVFRITTNGVFTSLFSFSGTNGGSPYAEVMQGDDGNLYGTTVNGGESGLGTVFKLATNGTAFSLLASFRGSNGANPYGGLVQAPGGVLYGTTAYGGAAGFGTVFRISTNGSLQSFYSFSGGADGANPWSRLVREKEGAFYGTTILGGEQGYGTAFQITTNGTLFSLVSFAFGDDGSSPYGGLLPTASGSFYGTANLSGPGFKGTLFRLDPAPPALGALIQPGGQVLIQWSAFSGPLYQLQYKTNLNQPNWTDLGVSFPATTNPVTLVQPTAPDAARFYRVRLIPPP